jgi:membrane protease YdiL (CAAX protease family)
MEHSVTPSALHRAYLAFEFVLLFVVVPVVLARMSDRLRWLLIPLLWLVAAACLVWLLGDAHFDRRLLWQAPDAGRWLGLGVAIVLPAAAILVLGTWHWTPQRLWEFPRQRPGLWALVMVLYPILSVYPQGVIYRGFLFQRYAGLCPNRMLLILVSGVAFGWMHVIFRNAVAPLLCLAGGVLFAWVYEASGSLLIAAAIHAVLGGAVFTVGQGRYFVLGTQALAARLAQGHLAR